MKAKLIAVALSLAVTTIPMYAGSGFKKTPDTPVSAVSNKIDLNKADVSSLTGSFKGIGKKRAEAIIAYRDSHQGFKSIEELAEVKGFSQHFVVANREKLSEVFIISPIP